MCPYPQETEDLVIFTEKISNGKPNLFCGVFSKTFVLFGR